MLMGQLDATARGDGSVVLIAGEPGIGKSRLLAEFTACASGEGWLTLSGRAYDSEGLPPYLPFVGALRAHLGGLRDADAMACFTGAGPEVALLFPEAHANTGPPATPLGLSPEAERYRLFEGFSAVLLNLAQSSECRGVLLSLDDLHWADRSTLLLLLHLARRLQGARLLIAGTYRTVEVEPSHPVFQVLAELRRERLDERIHLGPLSLAGTGELLAGLGEGRAAAAVVEAIHEQTQGNPFFIEEVVRQLQAEGRDLSDELAVTGVTIPESVRQVIGVRLARLRPESVRALQVAAALGDPFSFDTLAAAAGTGLGPVLDALDEASACGFVGGEGSGDYQFNHALVRETVYAGLSAPRRALLHAQVAGNLEAFHQANAAGHAGELAHHFLLGGRREDLVKAMGYALQAADRAKRQTAFEEAVRYYEMALDAHQRSEEQDEARRCEMLLALALATLKAGDWDRGDEINLAAAQAAQAAGLADLLARACLATAAAADPVANTRFIPLLEHALTATPGADSSCRSGLLSLLAYQRSKAGSWEGPASIRDESIAMARRLGDVRALAFALRNAYLGRNFNQMGGLEAQLQAVEEVVQLARELGDKELEVTSQCDHLCGSLDLGEIAAVDAGIEAHVRLADELQERMQIAHSFMLRSMRALLSGPLSWAEHIDAERQAVWRSYNAPWTAALATHFRLVLRWEQGRLAELQARYRAALERPATPTTKMTQVHLAFICSELGDAAEAHALVEQLGMDRFAGIPFDFDWPFALALLAHACSATGDARHAEVLYGLLLPRAGYVVAVDSANVCLGSTSRYLGLLATTLGRFEDAERHFDDADAMNTRLGARPLLAHTKVDRARLHLARRVRADLRRARQLLEEAAAAFEGLGMDYHAGKARALLGALPPAEATRPSYPDGLSPREAEVLRLIARGRSSKEIGEDLVLSTRTVERHIANIYIKTGTHGRAQATAYALAHAQALGDPTQ
jgi:DNA-binding CsgD family transcriptional regulator